MVCPLCSTRQQEESPHCTSCGGRLPRAAIRRRGLKVSRWFAGIPVAPGDPAVAALRVSRYDEEVELRTDDGSVTVPSHHVRFPIWVDGRAACVMSIPEEESERLAEFLAGRAQQAGGGQPPGPALTGPSGAT
jgi:hypothetical protein